jgi:hypothetical protein
LLAQHYQAVYSEGKQSNDEQSDYESSYYSDDAEVIGTSNPYFAIYFFFSDCESDLLGHQSYNNISISASLKSFLERL